MRRHCVIHVITMRRLRLSKQCVMSEVKAFFLDQNRYRGNRLPLAVGRSPLSDTRGISYRKQVGRVISVTVVYNNNNYLYTNYHS